MKKVCKKGMILFTIALFVFSMRNQPVPLIHEPNSSVDPYTPTWEYDIQHAEGESDYYKSFGNDSDGNLYTLGQRYNSTDRAVVLSKISPNGEENFTTIWYCGTIYEYLYVTEMCIDSTGIIVICRDYDGIEDFEIILIKFDHFGNILWNKTWDTIGFNDYAMTPVGATLDSAGNLYVSVDLNNLVSNDFRYLLVKFDSDGNELWNRIVGGGPFTLCRDVGVDSFGDVYLLGKDYLGYWEGRVLKYSSTGTNLWNTSLVMDSDLDMMAIYIDRNDTIFAYGDRNSTQIAIYKLNRTGHIQPFLTNSSLDPSIGGCALKNGITGDLQGNLLVQSRFSTYGDQVIVNISTQGNEEWVQTVVQSSFVGVIDDNEEGIFVAHNRKYPDYTITVKKLIIDEINPIVSILSPLASTNFSLTPPNFTIEVIEESIDLMWYTLNGGVEHYITQCTGTLDQDVWDKIPYGTVSIRFYVSDTAGNIGQSEVVIKKIETPSDPPPKKIPGYNIAVMLGVVGIAVMGISKFYNGRRKMSKTT